MWIIRIFSIPVFYTTLATTGENLKNKYFHSFLMSHILIYIHNYINPKHS